MDEKRSVGANDPRNERIDKSRNEKRKERDPQTWVVETTHRCSADYEESLKNFPGTLGEIYNAVSAAVERAIASRSGE